MSSAPAVSRLLMGNWKMNGSLTENKQLIEQIVQALKEQPTKHQIVFCAPFVYLPQLQSLLAHSPIQWGAQNASAYKQGAYTGEVSAAMLSDFGCQWVIVGHSERRTLFHESSQETASKVEQVVACGMRPVLCIGETQAQYDAGQTKQVLKKQLAPVLALGAKALKGLVVAYEPVWAIGSGRSATPEYAQQIHQFIHAQLQQAGCQQVPLLYGGSVNGDNATALFAQPNVHGALIGGASLKANEFLRIVAA